MKDVLSSSSTLTRMIFASCCSVMLYRSSRDLFAFVASILAALCQDVLSDIQVLHVECVFFDKLASWFDLLTHQEREHVLRFDGVIDGHL